MHKKWTLLFLIVFVCAGSNLMALEIPLNGGGASSAGGVKIGYIDMDRIFQIYPQTQVAKDDYAKQLKKKKDQLAEKEKELDDIKNRIGILESTLGTSVNENKDADNPEVTAASVPSLKRDLEEKKVAYEELKKRASQDLASFQSQQSQIILGKIYQALRDLALEEQVTIVVDKASILYGDATTDLTDKLQEKVRGY